MGVNARLMDPEVTARAGLRHLDGAVTERYLDEPDASPIRAQARGASPQETPDVVPAYVPPYPDRPQVRLPPLALLRLARRNVIAIWPEATFSKPFFHYRLLRRSIVVVNSPETVKQTFVDGGALMERKSPQQKVALQPLVGDGLFISEGETWRKRRKVVAPVTHISRLPELSACMSAGAWATATEWRALPAGAEINALEAMAHLTANVICAAIFGRHLDQASTDAVVSAFGTYQARIGQLDILSLIGVPDILPRFQGFRIRLAARRIHQVVDKLIDAILSESEAGAPSLLGAMMRTAQGGPASGMSRRAFRNEAAVLFMAGHETTANTLAWAWFLLSQDGESERRLHEEVDAALPPDRPARFEDLDRLPFTRAVIEETLRLYPPVPLQGRQASGEMTIGDIHLRRGDLVILNAWLLHRHKLLWSDPDAFVPDRFMPGGSGIPSRYAYVPFSIGPRICTGAAFGLMEAVISLATLARHTRLRLKPGHVVEPVCRLSLRPGERLPMIVLPR